jgi:hypothetical protein
METRLKREDGTTGDAQACHWAFVLLESGSGSGATHHTISLSCLYLGRLKPMFLALLSLMSRDGAVLLWEVEVAPCS